MGLHLDVERRRVRLRTRSPRPGASSTSARCSVRLNGAERCGPAAARRRRCSPMTAMVCDDVCAGGARGRSGWRSARSMTRRPGMSSWTRCRKPRTADRRSPRSTWRCGPRRSAPRPARRRAARRRSAAGRRRAPHDRRCRSGAGRDDRPGRSRGLLGVQGEGRAARAPPADGTGHGMADAAGGRRALADLRADLGAGRGGAPRRRTGRAHQGGRDRCVVGGGGTEAIARLTAARSPSPQSRSR